jgi:hypothetical protein
VPPLLSYKRFRSFNMSCTVSKRFTLQWALLYISGVLKKGNLDYH